MIKIIIKILNISLYKKKEPLKDSKNKEIKSIILSEITAEISLYFDIDLGMVIAFEKSPDLAGIKTFA